MSAFKPSSLAREKIRSQLCVPNHSDNSFNELATFLGKFQCSTSSQSFAFVLWWSDSSKVEVRERSDRVLLVRLCYIQVASAFSLQPTMSDSLFSRGCALLVFDVASSLGSARIGEGPSLQSLLLKCRPLPGYFVTSSHDRSINSTGSKLRSCIRVISLDGY